MGYCKSIVVLVFLCLQTMPAQAALSFIQPLGTPLVSTTNGGGVIGLAKGDFDGDGIVDLAVTRIDGVATGGQQGFVDVMRGKGDGTFEAPVTLYTFPVNVFGIGILARDFDGDGKLDLAVAVYPSHQILFFKGTGSPGTITFNAPVVTSTTHQPQGLQAADLNGDGKLDLVTSNPADNTVSVLLNLNVQSTGIFEPPTNYAVGSNPLDVAIGDVDGTPGPDLVVGNNGSSSIGVLLNNGDGTFGAMTSFSARLRPLGLYLADFDGDGKLDVVAAGNECNSPPPTISGGGCMVFMKGQGNGTFAVPADQNFTGLDSPPTAHLWTENVALDLNGDGKPDVLFVPSQGGGFGKSVIAVGLNTGDGTGTFHVSYWAGAPPQPTPSANPDFVQGVAAVLADFDGDGVPDLAYATQGKDNTRGAVSILFGATPWAFDVPRSYSTFTRNFGSDGGPTTRGGVFGDFAGNGKVDFAVLTSGGCPENGPLLAVFPGNGDDSFGDPIAATPIPSCHGGDSTLRSADLDKDGKLDLVFIGFDNGLGQNFGEVASGNGNGTFTLFSSFGFAGSTAQARNMVLGDFDGDGFPDVAVSENPPVCDGVVRHRIEVFLQGAGTKTFTSTSMLAVNGDCPPNATVGHGLVAADFNHDGIVDLVASTVISSSYSALFFKGIGGGMFQAPTVIGTAVIGGDGISDFTAADVNGDGHLDLIGIGGGAVWVQLGMGDGTFSQPPVAYDFGTSTFGGSCSDFCEVRVADIDGDGFPDIVVAAPSAFAGFSMLRGKGDGTFESPVKFAVGATGTSWLDVADVNGDGQPDVVIGHAGQNGNNFTVLINDSKPPAADLSISKADSPDPVTVGNNLTYTITVTNNGPSAATGVNVSDTLPAGETFVSVKPSQGSCTGTSTITCALGSLANGSSATVTLVVTPTQTGGISNTASVAANEFDPNLNNNHDTQVTTVNAAPSADLSITKSDSPDPVTVGSNLTYTITVKNNGPSGATGVTMTDPLPGTVTFVSATPSQGNCTGTATVTCSLGSLSNGASATVTIVVTPTQAGGISNTATVGANEADPDTSNNSATQPTTVNATIRQLTALSPARLWVGQNGSIKKLKYDLLAEVLVDGVTVGTGQLPNVKAGGSGFNQAVFDTITLALGSPTTVPPGASLSIRASVRISCATSSTGVSSIARLWYNGQPTDKGKSKDAGSRFDATIGGTNNNYFLRQAFTLDTTPGSSRQSIDVAVDGNTPCPARPFTPFGTWSVNLP
jgi:uncharacterized repeat protein (TIGR01451 family)